MESTDSTHLPFEDPVDLVEQLSENPEKDAATNIKEEFNEELVELIESLIIHRFNEKEKAATEEESPKRRSSRPYSRRLYGGVRRSSIDDSSTEKLLPEDTFSFLVFARVGSPTFWYGLGVFIFQMTLLSLLTSDSVDSSDFSNPVGIPADVNPAVRISQFLAMVVTVVSQQDVVESLNVLYKGYNESKLLEEFGLVSYNRWVLSASLRLLEGMFSIAVTFILIMKTDEVRDLLLNFTAVEFVSQLDDGIFRLAGWGYFGKKVYDDAHKVSDAEHPSSFDKVGSKFRKLCCLLTILLLLLCGWVVVIIQQVEGDYLCQTILVEFSDKINPGLGTFTGLYDVSKKKKFGSRQVYLQRLPGNKFDRNAHISYCTQDKVWALTYNEDDDACDDWAAKSSETETYDLLDTASSSWYTAKEARGYQRLQFPLESFELLCFDCRYDEDFCFGGKCEHNRCVCEEGRYGSRCEFATPCLKLQFPGSNATHEWLSTFDIVPGADVNYRPVYLLFDRFNNGGSLFEMVLFTGRRWVFMSPLPPGSGSNDLQDLTDKITLADYLIKQFHPWHSEVKVSFITETVDVARPSATATPAGLLWYYPSVLDEGISPSYSESFQSALLTRGIKLDTTLTCLK